VSIKPRYLGRIGRTARRLLGILGFGPHLLRAMSFTRKLDVLIVPGTGILDDFCSGPLGIPLDVFLWCLAARLTRTPVWFVSIGAGPIAHPLSRWLMVSAARMAQYRSYRDVNSKEFLAQAGVDTDDDLVFPDIAFDLPRPDSVAAAGPTDSLTVGVGVMEYWGWQASSESSAIHGTYQDGLSRFCVWLLEKGHRIRLLSGDSSDHRAIQALKTLIEVRLGDPTLMPNVLAEPARDLADVMTQMAATDVVVATRFHNVVCALKMGKPTLSLSYAEKNAALLEDAGLGGYVQHVEGFDIEELKVRFEQIAAERATLARSIAAFSALAKKRLQRQEELLAARLHGYQPDGGATAGSPAGYRGNGAAACRTPARASKGL
jgi:polysaccharide pyruvyl transferase WcaK-like protein